MDKLGIDPSVMLFQIINFGILVFVLNKFLYKPVLAAIKSKKEQLAALDIQKVELSKKEESLLTQKNKILEDAQKEKLELLREARLEAAKAKKEALVKAEKEAKNLIEKSKNDIEAEKVKLMRDFEKEILSASFAIAEKVVGKKVDKKDVNEAYKKLSSVKSQLWRNI